MAGTGELWLVSITIYAAHNKRGQRHGGKVPRPSAHANAPTGGVRAAGTGKYWLVSMAIYTAHNKRGQRRERM